MAQEKGISKAQGFTHGMVSDPDPRFQIKGSYSDALNIRLSNRAGDTFTAENIDGNRLFVDLYELARQDGTGNSSGILGTRTPANTGDWFSEIYWHPTNTNASGEEVGELFPHPTNPGAGGAQDGIFVFNEPAQPWQNRCSIVGYTSFGNEMILIIVCRDSGGIDRTVFLQLKYDEDMNLTHAYDLGVCYSLEDNYPDLGMELDKPVKVVSLVENDCIRRIYWTDNENPLRTLNIEQTGKNQLPKETLDITPLANMSQPVLSRTLHGSLPVGKYQYVYKYISTNGGETTFSPVSNLYHTSDQGFGNSTQYGGGPAGELGTQGFSITVHDLDNNYEFIELYSFLFEDLNGVPKVALVDKKRVTNVSEVTFTHLAWNNEIENGLNDILIESNTWTHCKDIEIKDNILFAANLKQKQNFISEKEWNVKVLRYRIMDATNTTVANVDDGILTTNDSEIKHYTTDAGGAVIEAPDLTKDFYGGDPEKPRWATLIEDQRHMDGSEFTGRCKRQYEFRYLRDGCTLGAESYQYHYNDLGGCRVSFGLKPKIADTTTNDGVSPYISSQNGSADPYTDEMQTDNIYTDDQLYNDTDNTDTVYQASMNLGGSQDPYLAGDNRGYQRGEIYRFGVQVFDKTGTPGNVLWIGDIQTPEMYDPLKMLKTEDLDYSPMASTENLRIRNAWRTLKGVYDHRLSMIWGQAIPPTDVNWFTGRHTLESDSFSKAYRKYDGQPWGANSYDPTGAGSGDGGWRTKYMTHRSYMHEHDDKHYLYDLFINFEFIIPEDVRKKISGFRVVRAERTEQDRRIVQQGLLNQCMKYGYNDRDKGYDDSIQFCKQDNSVMDDEPVYTNSTDTSSPTKTIQPEYDSYLNGYIGLAENNHIAYYDDTYNAGKLTANGYTNGKVFAWREGETRYNYQGGITSWSAIYGTLLNSTDMNTAGPGSSGVKHHMSAFFGSYERCETGNPSTGGVGKNRCTWLADYIFTLDSPDSAFGVRPYLFKEGDFIRIDCILKLSDEDRYEAAGNPQYPVGTHFFNQDTDAMSQPGGNTDQHKCIDGQRNKAIDEAVRFASVKEQDKTKKNGRLIGKFYCYDTYWGIGMETDGGRTYAADSETAHSADSIASPKFDYRQQREIGAAKEIGDGEIIPASFFLLEPYMTDNYMTGFSNNTLGFISDDSDWYARWGAVHKDVTAIGSYDATNDIYLQEEEDLNYHTASTMQMGLRTIVIETTGGKMQMHPRHLGSILLNQSWLARYDDFNTHTNKDFYYLGTNYKHRKAYMPFKYLCSIVRKVVPYGGSSKSAINATRYMSAGNFHRIKDYESMGITGRTGHLSQVFGGDTFVNLYSHQKTACSYMRNSYARWQVFPVESFVNTDMRGGNSLNSGKTELGNDLNNPPFSNDWLYNNVYSQENNIKSALMLDENRSCESEDLPYEIAYSETKLLGEQGDAFRRFPLNNFHDMEGKYGEINKLLNFKNELYVFQDEAFAKLLVNPISMITDDAGSSLFTGTGDTVENHVYISTKFGTRHSDSVTTSEDALYYIDSRYARLIKYDTEKVISLGDSLGQRSTLRTLIKDMFQLDSFEKDGRNYISDNTLRFLGIQSIFDHRNKELITTFHNSDRSTGDAVSATLVFNEGLNAFSSFYSVTPARWIHADPAILHTQNQISSLEFLTIGNVDNLRQDPLKLWLWDSNPSKTDFYNEGAPDGAYIEKIINDHASENKVFDNGRIIGTPDLSTIDGNVDFNTEISALESLPLGGSANSRYREGILRFPLRTITSAGRQRGTWLKMKFNVNSSVKFNIFAMIAKYRKSYN